MRIGLDVRRSGREIVGADAVDEVLELVDDLLTDSSSKGTVIKGYALRKSPKLTPSSRLEPKQDDILNRRACTESGWRRARAAGVSSAPISTGLPSVFLRTLVAFRMVQGIVKKALRALSGLMNVGRPMEPYGDVNRCTSWTRCGLYMEMQLNKTSLSLHRCRRAWRGRSW